MLQGDSGGAATCGGYLAGVTSWGEADCSLPLPVGYVRLSYFKAWIELNANW